MRCRSIHVHIRADNIFVRDLDDGQQMGVAAYFTSNVYDVDEKSIDLQSITADLSNQVEHFNFRGSNFIQNPDVSVNVSAAAMTAATFLYTYARNVTVAITSTCF